VEQHRLVYASLEGLIGGAVHALQLETRAVETDD
jgi:stress-induced morphogen